MVCRLIALFEPFVLALLGTVLLASVLPVRGALVLVLCCVLLATVFLFTKGFGKLLGLPRADAVVLLFCGSKKSLASGVPVAGVLFAPEQVGAIILPLMLFHQIQLIACAVLARRLGKADVAD